MNFVKVTFFSAVAALSMSSVYANGYHMSSTDLYTGTMTIRSTGSCKSNVTYEKVRYGYIQDGNNVIVGHGILSYDGYTILALNNQFPGEYISGTYNGSSTASTAVFFEDLISDATAATIQSLSMCNINKLISGSKSKNIQKIDPSKSIDSRDITFYFNGISPYLRLNPKNNHVDKAQLFSGKITFKGNRSNDVFSGY